MYNHNKAQQSKNHVHISWDILYASQELNELTHWGRDKMAVIFQTAYSSALF